MARYHINPAGDVGVCKAAVSSPFGDMEADHYGSKGEARQAYERKMAEEANAPKKAYRSYSKAESMEVARTIKSQIGSGPLMALGAHSFTAIEGSLRFNARILPFNKTGESKHSPLEYDRGSAPQRSRLLRCESSTNQGLHGFDTLRG